MGKIRGTHSSPGIYTQITDLTYAANSLGITTAALVGETLKGPAFEPIMVRSKTEYREYFGGTSAEKYKDSEYPRYELPYIANSYLSASDQLYVCRVLGLSGYNAGPAFILTASKSGENKKVIGVLRSRGSFVRYGNTGTACEPNSVYDKVVFNCDKIELQCYTSLSTIINGCSDNTLSTSTEAEIKVNQMTMGQFTIVAKKGNSIVGKYPVSLNAGAQDYIYKVLGGVPTDGDAALFVEELYDVFLADLISNGDVDRIDATPIIVAEAKYTAVSSPVLDTVSILPSDLTRKNVGQTFVYSASFLPDGMPASGFTYYKTNSVGIEVSGISMDEGGIYKVVTKRTDEGKIYVYNALVKDDDNVIASGKVEGIDEYKVVNVLSFDAFACVEDGSLKFMQDMSDYHSQFRCATTPWIVSEVKGNDVCKLEVKKLFRFHTITDGDCANTEVKISISNIRPDEGLFDVVVRDFGDSDGNQTILESYKNLTMVPGDSKYIGLKIGTLDGAYELKSKYVMVEIIENDMTAQCVPAGFLGYPVRVYKGADSPSFSYNLIYDEDIKAKRQFFGLSDIKGVDEDMLSFKGKNAYTENYAMGYTHGFHLDSLLSAEVMDSLNISGITVDGEEGVVFDAVSVNNVTEEGVRPLIGSEADMQGSIFEDASLRKFTVYPCGGFDGWDIYRNSRTTGDEFKANKYKGKIANGYGSTFSKIDDGASLALTGNCITSDYYAWLAGANQFEIPEKYLINIFATPGIDYVNDTLLSSQILDMIETKRMDSIYIMTTPDKPRGANDDISSMYSSAEVASNLEDAGIDSYYAATYYPWVKFFDSENNKYINLPATKDALRNLANIDNKKFPWYAPAGMERGVVECQKMHFYAKLEDEDNAYDGRINPLKTFSKDGVLIWGNKTMYSNETPMNRINVTRLLLYMRKLINESCRKLIFEPNGDELVGEFRSIVEPILSNIKSNRGITDFKLKVSQTAEERDAHEMSCQLWVKPTPTLEYLEINFMVTPQGVSFED